MRGSPPTDNDVYSRCFSSSDGSRLQQEGSIEPSNVGHAGSTGIRPHGEFALTGPGSCRGGRGVYACFVARDPCFGCTPCRSPLSFRNRGSVVSFTRNSCVDEALMGCVKADRSALPCPNGTVLSAESWYEGNVFPKLASRRHIGRWKILEEILSWDCDVVALQEVDHHHDWLSPMLARGGYRSLFVKKPLAPGMEYDPRLEDGCSVFYRSCRSIPAGDSEGAATQQAQTTLELLDSHSFTFAVAEGRGSEGGSPGAGGGDASPSIQNQVAMLALFRVHRGGRGDAEATEEDAGVRPGSLVVLATTHLKAVKSEAGEEARAQQVGDGSVTMPPRHKRFCSPTSTSSSP